MDHETSLRLQREGAAARAAGLGRWDCYLYESQHLPAQTGETVEEWSARVDAWQLGYQVEDLMRRTSR